MTNFNVSRRSGVQYKSFSLTSKASAPDWERIPHKGMERPSEAEFNVKIDELAKGLAEARLQNDSIQYENLSLEGDKLRAQYISAVSPDRKSMVKDATEMMKQAKAGRTDPDASMNLIDYLNKKEGIEVVHSGSDLQPDTFELKESKMGQVVMGYTSGNWYHVNTPQEQAMQQTFLSRLNKTEDQYYRQYVNGDIQEVSGHKNIDYTV
ncbi:hypothetical protein [Lacrimispora sp.]|uniref:hypothetical protein n=1 Tax=Lacrimispora sp. TaxID=2719234 RepID=UPI0032E406E0